jgi:hypothetical protein
LEGEFELAIIEGFCTGVVVNGVSGKFINAGKDIYSRITTGKSLKEIDLQNHDLQRSIISSYLHSLVEIYETCKLKLSNVKGKESENKNIILYINEIEKEVLKEIKKLNNTFEFELPINSFSQLRFLLIADENSESEYQYMINQLKEIPPKYRIEHEVFSGEVDSSLYSLVSKYFAYEIKHNEKARAIFNAQISVLTDIKVDNISQSIDYLSNQAKIMHTAIKELIEEGFEKGFTDVKELFETRFTRFEKDIFDFLQRNRFIDPSTNSEDDNDIPTFQLNNKNEVINEEEATVFILELEYRKNKEQYPLINYYLESENEIKKELEVNRNNKMFTILSKKLLEQYDNLKIELNEIMEVFLQDNDIQKLAPIDKFRVLKELFTRRTRNIIYKRIYNNGEEVFEVSINPIFNQVPNKKVLVCTDFIKDGFYLNLTHEEYSTIPSTGMVVDHIPDEILINEGFPCYIMYKYRYGTNRKIMDLYHFAFSKSLQP